MDDNDAKRPVAGLPTTPDERGSSAGQRAGGAHFATSDEVGDRVSSDPASSNREGLNISDRRRRLGALFPEIPVDAERQVLGLGLLVGALTFTAMMGWGPIGRWLSGFHVTSHRVTAATTQPRGRGSAALAVPTIAIPNVSAPKVTTPKITVPISKATLPVVAVPDTVVETSIETVPVSSEQAVTEPAVVTEVAAPTTVAATEPPTTAAPPPPLTIDPTIPASSSSLPTVGLPGDGVPEDFTVYFENRLSEPIGIELSKIKPLAAALSSLPAGTTVKVVGHASPTGSPAANAALSNARARGIVDRLKSAIGPNASTLNFVVEAKGETEPLGDEALSRRVTVEVQQ